MTLHGFRKATAACKMNWVDIRLEMVRCGHNKLPHIHATIWNKDVPLHFAPDGREVGWHWEMVCSPFRSRAYAELAKKMVSFESEHFATQEPK